MTKQKGFTLAELLIVVVILGVLGSLALPRFFPQKEKAIVAEAVGILSAIRMGEEGYKLENGVYMTGAITWASLGMDDPNTPEAKSRNFAYTIPAVAGNATFVATATRCTNEAWCKNAGTASVVTLNNAGNWCADGGTLHPNCPT